MSNTVLIVALEQRKILVVTRYTVHVVIILGVGSVAVNFGATNTMASLILLAVHTCMKAKWLAVLFSSYLCVQ